MENTKIAWADDTFNAWWGCIKVSPECKNCYASAFDKRLGGNHWGPGSTRKLATESYWKNLEKWDKQAATWTRYRRVFVNSMSDIGEEHPDVEGARSRLFYEIRQRKNLAFMLLTKRLTSLIPLLFAAFGEKWPENLWLGTTVGTRARVGEIETLRSTPAALKFVSVEPLLEALGCVDLSEIDWTIVGGESGSGAREMKPEWVWQMRENAVNARSAFFFKQTGTWLSRALSLKSSKGENFSEWPNAYQIQELPRLASYGKLSYVEAP